jgi:hypothetical protein
MKGTGASCRSVCGRRTGRFFVDHGFNNFEPTDADARRVCHAATKLIFVKRCFFLRLIFLMAKAEISWKRVDDDGEKLQVYARQVGRDWLFFHRGKRFDQWQRVEEPPLEDWLALLDAMQRLINRRRYQPIDEQRLRQQIRDRFPEAEV